MYQNIIIVWADVRLYKWFYVGYPKRLLQAALPLFNKERIDGVIAIVYQNEMYELKSMSTLQKQNIFIYWFIGKHNYWFGSNSQFILYRT